MYLVMATAGSSLSTSYFYLFIALVGCNLTWGYYFFVVGTTEIDTSHHTELVMVVGISKTNFDLPPIDDRCFKLATGNRGRRTHD